MLGRARGHAPAQTQRLCVDRRQPPPTAEGTLGPGPRTPNSPKPTVSRSFSCPLLLRPGLVLHLALDLVSPLCPLPFLLDTDLDPCSLFRLQPTLSIGPHHTSPGPHHVALGAPGHHGPQRKLSLTLDPGCGTTKFVMCRICVGITGQSSEQVHLGKWKTKQDNPRRPYRCATF